ncbi:hypothetical protein C2G38_2311123 [Gigaspora rosea]|uniref:Uncharacterized protein n=1 Tax=Gigaspora rosea TaxID=44941 RepID=A0A397V8E3_9GLOM|nr:hypothetical protein C2G38_2311123 [Gigaspora rosea]
MKSVRATSNESVGSKLPVKIFFKKKSLLDWVHNNRSGSELPVTKVLASGSKLPVMEERVQPWVQTPVIKGWIQTTNNEGLVSKLPPWAYNISNEGQFKQQERLDSKLLIKTFFFNSVRSGSELPVTKVGSSLGFKTTNDGRAGSDSSLGF